MGLQETTKSLGLRIYNLSHNLKIADSNYIELPSSSAENYLNLSYDTLHNFLNIYLQKKDAKDVTIFRFNGKMQTVATIPGVEIARLNNSSLFSGETLFSGRSVYSLKTENDSTGKQFYINKYELKSDLENFDYLFKWQFPFERKNVSAAHLFYADAKCLLLYVIVGNGLKSGEWILKLDPVNGTLIKASKVNEKGDNSTYFFGNFYQDKNDKSFLVAGQKLVEQQFNPVFQKTDLSKAQNLSFYIFRLDSAGEIQAKQEFILPIVDLPSGAKKTVPGYLMRINSIRKNPDSGFTIETDIFRSGNNAPCFLYVNTLLLSLSPGENGWTLKKAIVQQNKLIEDYYASNDKLDMNGKLCVESGSDFGNMFYKNISFPVKLCFKSDTESNSIWLLSKSNSAKKNIDYSVLAPQGNTYKIRSLELISKLAQPSYIRAGESSLIIGSETAEGKYQLTLYNW